MPGFTEKAANLLEYFGVRSQSHYLARFSVNYRQDDPMAYGLDLSSRADIDGLTDAAGKPLSSSATLLPVHVLLWALGNLELQRRYPTPQRRESLKAAVDWLLRNQETTGTWPARFPTPRFGLDRPFPSAMTQGLAISMLLRAGRVLNDGRCLPAAVNALRPFNLSLADGGVTTHHADGLFFEEYPCQPPRHVLNGALYAMFGLWDMVRFEDNSDARRLWDEGLITLIKWLPQFDLGYWSLYHIPQNPKNPATVKYHQLHVDQLTVMHAITGEPEFAKYRDRWQGYLDSRFNALRTLPAKLRWLVSGG
jgi:heparosan-N-sulfate-glucuronate 5-epimerase